MPYYNPPLVGMHFRPPAKDVVQNLAAGTEVLCVRQPENPHDDNAIQVLLPGFCEGGQHSALFQQLIDQQSDPDVKALFVDPLPLGYVDAKKTGSAAMISAAMDAANMISVPATLSFSMSGNPTLEIQWSDAGDGKAGPNPEAPNPYGPGDPAETEGT